MIINNLRDLAEMLSADGDSDDELKRRIERNVYKYTACGAWISLSDTGIRIGSIVEGSDIGTSSFALDYPFTEDEYRTAEAAIEAEADAVWDWANVTRYVCGCGWDGTDEDVEDWAEDAEDGAAQAVCPQCGAKPIRGETDAEHGLDFPDVWADHMHMRGFCSPQ